MQAVGPLPAERPLPENTMTAERKLDLLTTAAHRGATALRNLSRDSDVCDQISDEQACDLANLATWIDGVIDEDPAYSRGAQPAAVGHVQHGEYDLLLRVEEAGGPMGTEHWLAQDIPEQRAEAMRPSGYWDGKFVASCRNARFAELLRDAWNSTYGPPATKPPTGHGYRPEGFEPCTRAPEHDGPCAHHPST